MAGGGPHLAAMQNPFEAASAFALGFMDFLAKQQAQPRQHTAAVTPAALPLPEAAQFNRLQQSLFAEHARLWAEFMRRGSQAAAAPIVEPEAGDRRFAAPEWSSSAHFDYLRQAYLLNARFLKQAAELLPVADGSAKRRLRYLTRQFVDAMAPSNFAATNPEFIETALATKGESITAGIRNLVDDLQKGRLSMTDESAFEVGRNLAATPGAVVFENELIQLIQYAPATDSVAERPYLMVPPCINKFYVLDLQAENSFVRYLVGQGHTVFLVSWRNPRADLGHLRWDDYVELGPLTAFRVVREICSVDRINVLGFCVGGTLVAAALAVAQARGDEPAASLTLFTTLLDFSDAGEIGSFVDESTVAAREAAIGKGGLLLGRELATVFASLRANDLIWQYVVGNYLKGRTPDALDLLYWNSDSTNLPGPFLVYYLRHMYLNNSLRVPGKLEFCGVRCDLSRVAVPTFVLATREDHIVPWRTAYLSREVLGGPSTFVLGASGHIAGVINPATKNKRSYWTNEAAVGNAEEWLAEATENKGSWWPHYADWLAARRGGERPARVQLGSDRHQPGEPAPGRYVKERA